VKVIFLDNDGVICLSSNWGSRHKKQKKWGKRKLSMTSGEIPVEYRFDNFDKKAIRVLNEILKETDAEIIISSDWRLYATLDELGEYYTNQGIIKKPIGVTELYRNIYPSDNVRLGTSADLGLDRYLEIKHWLENHSDITHWVAIDDLDMSTQFLGDRFASIDNSNERPGLTNFVHTPLSSEGIKQSGVKEKVLSYLK